MLSRVILLPLISAVALFVVTTNAQLQLDIIPLAVGQVQGVGKFRRFLSNASVLGYLTYYFQDFNGMY